MCSVNPDGICFWRVLAFFGTLKSWIWRLWSMSISKWISEDLCHIHRVLLDEAGMWLTESEGLGFGLGISILRYGGCLKMMDPQVTMGFIFQHGLMTWMIWGCSHDLGNPIIRVVYWCCRAINTAGFGAHVLRTCNPIGLLIQLLPSGKLSHNYGKIHHFSWVDPRFLWPFSIANCQSLPGRVRLAEFYPIPWSLGISRTDCFPVNY